MLERLRQRSPNTSIAAILFHVLARNSVFVVCWLFFRARAFHADRVPDTGAVLLAANHQSFLDPPLIGGCVRPRLCSYLARASLFRSGVFGAMLRALNCIPLKDESGDLGAIKECLRRLDDGHAVLIFPEGSRTFDGALQDFKRGVGVLVRRSKCPVIPVAIEGCFDAWPRTKPWPRPWSCPIAVMYGHPIDHDELMKNGSDAALQRLKHEIEVMRLELRAKLREATGGAYPPRGLGDRHFTALPTGRRSLNDPAELGREGELVEAGLSA